MAFVENLRDTIQGFLPQPMWDYWWAVLVWVFIMLALIIALIIKLAAKKKGVDKVQDFKQQNPRDIARTSRKVPGDQKAVMEQHNVHVPHEQYKQLDGYITAMLQRGMKPAQIKGYLVNVGWDARIVDEALSRLVKR